MNRLHSAIATSVVLGSAILLLLIHLISAPQTAVFGMSSYPQVASASITPTSLDNNPGISSPTQAAIVDYIPLSAEQPSVYIKIVEDAKAASQIASNETPADGCPLSPKYPVSIQQWCGLIAQAAVDTGLDANFIAAVMLQESGGNSEAYSRSGAVGLMQVMPRDGLAAEFMCKNGPCFANRPTSEELFDPAFNIQFGTRMLAGLANRHGSLREALKAYGPIDVGYSYADKVLAIYENYQ